MFGKNFCEKRPNFTYKWMLNNDDLKEYKEYILIGSSFGM